MSYKRADDLDGNDTTRQYNATALNGIVTPIHLSSSFTQNNDEAIERIGMVRSETAESTLSQEGPKIPRGGVIGRTPTPPSAPTPVYDKDAR